MGRYRAFLGANGWYVAWEDDDGFHHQPSGGPPMEIGDDAEEEARAEAARLNACEGDEDDEDEDDDEDDDDDNIED